MDFNTTAELRARFAIDPNVSLEHLCEVDFATHGRPVTEVVDRTFDYILASHVFEHIPDPIRWLQELSRLLNSGGVLSLAIPDRRYTFDLLRPPTTIGDLLEAYYARKQRPSFRNVFDQHYLWRVIDTAAIWAGTQEPRDFGAPSSPESNLRLALSVIDDPGKYEDVHCTVVTDREFAELFVQIAAFGLSDLSITGSYKTDPADLEFFVQLGKSSERR